MKNTSAKFGAHFLLLFILAISSTNYVKASCGVNATINAVPISSPHVRTVFCQGEVPVLAFYSTYPHDACNDCNENAYTTWSNGIQADSITVTSSGTYIAIEHQDSLTAITCGYSYPGGIIYSDTFNIIFLPINRPSANPGVSRILPACGADTLGGWPTASGGTPPYTYSWSPDSGLAQNYYATTSNPVVYGVSNPYNYAGIISPNTYRLVVTDSLGCTATDSVTITPLLTAPITPPVATLNGCELSCQILPNFTYQWYHNENLVAGATSPTYSEDSSGSWKTVITSTVYPLCHISSNYVSPFQYQAPQICIVTLDSTNTYNLVVWDNNPPQGINKFRIYKLSDSTSQYVLLAEQPQNDFSTYLDTTSKPAQSSASYKISMLDTCGNESYISYIHTTILLSSNQGINNTVNLSWNAYQGFTYSNFEIWRSANGGPMTLLTTVSNTILAYVDNSPPAQAYYQIRVTNPNGCNPSRSAFDYSTVRSNIVNNTPTAIQSINALPQSLILFPNPSTGMVNLRLTGQYGGPATLRVIDLLGRLVKEQAIEIKAGGNMNINLTSTGTYFIEVVTSDGLVKKGIVTIQ